MNKIAYAILLYFAGIFIFKLLGDMKINAHVNYYWLFSSFIFCYIFYEFRKIAIRLKNLYFKRDYLLYLTIITSMSAYWGVMLLLRIIVSFKIEMYDKLINSARSITTGVIVIILIFAVLIFKLIRKNDSKNER